MPGIVGIVTARPGAAKAKMLKIMVQSMIHEDFYKVVQVVEEGSGVYAAWVGHPGSFSDCMPAVSSSGETGILFSGEEFSQPQKQGDGIKPGGASCLPDRYERNPGEFFGELNGCFQGLIIRKEERKTCLFNDRFGLKRLYWCRDDEDFLFSSEAKAILRVRPELRKICPRSLGEFFSLGSVLEDRTLYKNIFLLPAGSNWIFKNGRLKEMAKYFHPSQWEDQDPLPAGVWYDQLRTNLREVLPDYCNSESPIALSLTGGLDTRIILSNFDPPEGKLPTFTFGGIFRDSFDVKVARKVARACGQSHEVLRIGEEFFHEFPDLATKTVYITDGDLDLTGTPELFLNRMARQIAPIRLTGNFGSEVIRGNRTIKAVSPEKGILERELEGQVRLAAETLRFHEQCHWLTFVLFKQNPWHHHGRMSLEESQVTLRTPFLDNGFLGLLYQSADGPDVEGKVSMRLIADGNRKVGGITSDRGYRLHGNPLTRAVSRMFYETVFKAEYVFDYGMPPWLSKIDRAFEWIQLRRFFLGWHKFYHFRTWFQKDLSSFVREVLLDRESRKRPYLVKGSMERLVSEHMAGVRNNTVLINKLITLELVHRLLIEQ